MIYIINSSRLMNLKNGIWRVIESKDHDGYSVIATRDAMTYLLSKLLQMQMLYRGACIKFLCTGKFLR